MKFTCNTKPIVDGIDLGIISSNVSKFYQKSCIVELNIENNSLRINTEASSVKSELVFKGQASGDGENHAFVDSLLFKQLLKTLDSDIIEFEISENGVTVYSGKSKFNLPQVVSGLDLELDRPETVNYVTDTIDVDQDGWNFIKDNQMYAIAMSFIHPVYTNVWINDSKDVLVGDFDNSIFTHSSKVGLSSTCLLPDTVVNLLTTIPENSKIIPVGKNYEISVVTDPYTYLCEFSPKYESDEGVGDYSSDAILGLFKHPDKSISINIDQLEKSISQAELFAATNSDTIDFKADLDQIALVNDHVNCVVPTENPFEPFNITFKISLFKDAINHLDSKEVNISPLIQGDEAAGLVIWTDNMDVVLAGIE